MTAGRGRESCDFYLRGHNVSKGPPKTVALNHDEYSAEYVGRTTDGRQFFLTTPFVPKMQPVEGREFLALYVFDKAGTLVSATIDDLGPRETMDEAARLLRRDSLLASLGAVKHRRIKVAPFRVEMFGSSSDSSSSHTTTVLVAA